MDDYDDLETLNLCKLRLSEHDPLFSNDLDSHATFHNNFDYYTNNKFHKSKTSSAFLFATDC